MKEEDKLILELDKLIKEINLNEFEELNEIINEIDEEAEKIEERN
jgi:vacuolar-type H+-ATPase subunit E/Vma4